MSKLSLEKLNNFKHAKCYTNKRISKETNIPIATIDRLFSGANKNPTITVLQKVATVLNCTVDDFIEYEKTPVVIEKEALEIAKEIQKNEILKKFFSSVLTLENEDVKALLRIVSKIN